MGTTFRKRYKLLDDSKLTFKVEIGYNQPGYSIVSLGGEKLLECSTSKFELEIPGTGDDLHGLKLTCTTTVTDIQPGTDMTSVTYELTGGVRDFKKTLKEEVEFDGATEIYFVNYILYK